MNILRINLPPLRTLTAESLVCFARVDVKESEVEEMGSASLMQLGLLRPTASQIECFLHPEDSLLVAVALPALTPAKIKAAVTCAVQAFILGPVESVYVAHGSRDNDGQVHVAWLQREALVRLGQTLKQARLKLRGLYPAPYALHAPPAGYLTACLQDQHMLLRRSHLQVSVHPLPEDALQVLSTDGALLLWVGDGAPHDAEQVPDSCLWTGQVPDWGLRGGLQSDAVRQQGWGRAAVLCAVALGVWALGLNFYAARQEVDGQQLKTRMSHRVQQVFPELPVILNPLQQARQQLEARHNADEDAVRGFNNLVKQANIAMPFLVGAVEELNYKSGELQLRLLDGARVPATSSGWQGVLSQAGIEASFGDQNLILRQANSAVPGAGPVEVHNSYRDEND